MTIIIHKPNNHETQTLTGSNSSLIRSNPHGAPRNTGTFLAISTLAIIKKIKKRNLTVHANLNLFVGAIPI